MFWMKGGVFHLQRGGMAVYRVGGKHLLATLLEIRSTLWVKGVQSWPSHIPGCRIWAWVAPVSCHTEVPAFSEWMWTWEYFFAEHGSMPYQSQWWPCVHELRSVLHGGKERYIHDLPHFPSGLWYSAYTAQWYLHDSGWIGLVFNIYPHFMQFTLCFLQKSFNILFYFYLLLSLFINLSFSVCSFAHALHPPKPLSMNHDNLYISFISTAVFFISSLELSSSPLPLPFLSPFFTFPPF